MYDNRMTRGKYIISLLRWVFISYRPAGETRKKRKIKLKYIWQSSAVVPSISVRRGMPYIAADANIYKPSSPLLYTFGEYISNLAHHFPSYPENKT
jgi:hypothetical protein